MLKLATTLLGLTLALGSAQAQEKQEQEQVIQLPVGSICDSTADFENFIDEYSEKPFASSNGIVRGINGKLYQGKLLVYVNPETYSTTVAIHFPEDDVTCVLAMGDDFGPAIQDPGI
mgnify:FL=1